MFGNLALARYRFVLQAATPLHLSHFAGATLRGGFGHLFKRNVCIWPPADCPRCTLRHSCAYPYVFETAPPPGSAKLRGLDQVPRPYVIEPPEVEPRRTYRLGEQLEFGLVLFGRGIDYFPHFVFTFIELGRTGLGRDDGRFTVASVHAHGRAAERCLYVQAEGILHNDGDRLLASDLAAAVGEAPRQTVTVTYLTPARIRQEGRVQAVVSFQDLVRALLRRISSLCYFHGGSELRVDFAGLVEQASTVRTVTSRLRWYDQERFSSKQRQRIEMGGVVGEVVYEAAAGATLEPYWPLLAVGEWVHVGKGTVMGLGKIRVAAG